MSARPVSYPSTDIVVQTFDMTVKSKFWWSMELNVNKKFLSERDIFFSAII